MKKNGFTLLELMIVVGILALLISILLPSLSRARQMAKDAAMAAALQEIEEAEALKGATQSLAAWSEQIPYDLRPDEEKEPGYHGFRGPAPETEPEEKPQEASTTPPKPQEASTTTEPPKPPATIRDLDKLILTRYGRLQGRVSPLTMQMIEEERVGQTVCAVGAMAITVMFLICMISVHRWSKSFEDKDSRECVQILGTLVGVVGMVISLGIGIGQLADSMTPIQSLMSRLLG